MRKLHDSSSTGLVAGGWRLALALAIALSGSCATAGPLIENIVFGQADWYGLDDSLAAANSLWGRLDMDFTGDVSQTFYLNVVAQTGSTTSWVVGNLPVFSQSIDPGTVRVAVDLDLQDLGLSDGTNLSTLDAHFTLSTDVLNSAPTGTFSSYGVSDLFYRVQTEDGLLADSAPFGAPAGIKAAAAATNVTEHVGVPRVKEDNSQCMPGSFARSISWLDKQGLGSGKTAQQIYSDLKDKIGIEKNLAREKRIEEKAKYLKGINSAAVTKVLDVSKILGPIEGVSEDSTSDLLAWLRREMKTEDVELAYKILAADGTAKGSHILTVTGIYQQGEDWYLKFRDDESQLGSGNDNTGDTAEKRAKLGKLDTGEYWFRNDKRIVTYAVSESIPEPVFMQMAGLMGLSAAALRIRRARA